MVDSEVLFACALISFCFFLLAVLNEEHDDDEARSAKEEEEEEVEAEASKQDAHRCFCESKRRRSCAGVGPAGICSNERREHCGRKRGREREGENLFQFDTLTKTGEGVRFGMLSHGAVWQLWEVCTAAGMWFASRVCVCVYVCVCVWILIT